MTLGFFINSCAFPIMSPMPPMPPMPPIPPKGFAPPPNPPMPPRLFKMSAIPPIPPMPPGMPPIPPNGLAPPPNGLAPPPKGLAPAPPRPEGSACFRRGPALSSVMTSTLAYSAYPSPSSSRLFFFFFLLSMPSTRASASALRNSDFSKKDAVEIPRSSSSFFISLALTFFSFSISSCKRTCRVVVESVLVVDEDDDVEDEDSDVVVVVVDAVDFGCDCDDCLGWRPLARASTKASTSSDFSKKAAVEMP
mmetsp:Transcript_108764/g.313372  ORF Transcript_108764/g.313372 Transcript_108764/m.313372 type:complete len:250 (+) Transcript_108764:155-904(+)